MKELITVISKTTFLLFQINPLISSNPLHYITFVQVY